MRRGRALLGHNPYLDMGRTRVAGSLIIVRRGREGAAPRIRSRPPPVGADWLGPEYVEEFDSDVGGRAVGRISGSGKQAVHRQFDDGRRLEGSGTAYVRRDRRLSLDGK